jgi:spermidine/putrescine transport system substrate-binding protein
MKKICLLLCIVLLTSASLSGCTSSSSKPTLYVYNWGEYMDTSVNSDFEKEFNCKVVYELYDSNESMYQKVKSNMSTYDVVFPSDYLIQKMVKEDMLAELNLDNIPNIVNINPSLMNMAYDPTNKYSVPYFWGTVGILYNKTMVSDPVDTWGVLWNEKYAKQLYMYDSQRDSLGITLKYLGYSLNTRNLDELNAAADKLIEQKPLVLAYYTDQIMELMAGDEAALGVVYSGDAITAMNNNENLGYSVPKEGSNIWFDAVAVLKGSPNKELAEKYINFLCRDEIALRNTEAVNYQTCNKNIEPELRTSDWANNEAYFPPQDVISRCEVFEDPGTFVETYYSAWLRVRGNP